MTFIQKYIAGSFMIIVSLIFLIASIRLDQDVTNPGEGSFLPAFVSIIMLLAGVKVLFEGRKETSPSPAHLDHIDEHEIPKKNYEKTTEEDDELELDETWDKKDYLIALSYFVIVVLYVISLPYLSFFLSSFIFLVVSMYFLKGVSLWKNLLISLITIGTIYVIFKVLFQIVFP